jgi:hypothetical protein
MTHPVEPTDPAGPVDDDAHAAGNLEVLFWRFGADAHSTPDDEPEPPVATRRRHRHSWPGRRRAGRRRHRDPL